MTKLSVEETAYRAIIDMVVSRDFLPGSAVPESLVAEKLNISRTPARSALKRLVSDGLLEYKINKGCFVPCLTKKDLDSLTNFRQVIEPACAAEAANKYTPEFKPQMDALLLEEEDCIKNNGIDLHIINEKIHGLVIEISGNDYYARPIRQSMWRYQLYLFFFHNFYSDYQTRIAELKNLKKEYKSPIQHLLLFKAIATHDAESASNIMKEHISGVYKYLTRKEW